MTTATGGLDDQQIKNLRMGMQTVIDTLPHVIKILNKKEDDADRRKIIDDLRSTIGAYIDQERQYQDSMDALASTRLEIRDQISLQEQQLLGEENSDKNRSRDEQTSVDVDEIFKDAKQKLPKVSSKYVEKHPKMKEFESRLDIELRAISEYGNGNDQDNDLQIVEDVCGEIIATQFINTIDPITRLEMKDPVKNTLCGHTYEKNSIQQIIKKNPKTKCPIAGCPNKNHVSQNHLILDSDVLQEIQKKNRRAKK